MTTPLSNQIIREITPLSDKDCFYIAHSNAVFTSTNMGQFIVSR